MLLALSIVKCLDKTRKYTERNKKNIFCPFFLFCLIYGCIRSTEKRPMDVVLGLVVSFLARGSDIMNCEELAVYFVNLGFIPKY